MTFIVCLFQASSHGSCTFEKREPDLQCRWKVSECACRLFFVHSIRWYFFLIPAIHCLVTFFYFLLTGEHWLCLTMKNDPREKTKSCQTSGRWFIRKSTKRNSCFSSYLSFLWFQLLFPALLDDGQAYQILAHKLQKRKRDKILPIDSQNNAFASFRITAFFFCGPGCLGRQCYSLD